MCWDAACSSNENSYYTGNSYRHHVKTAPFQTHIEMIRESFKRTGEDMFGEDQGYKMPRIVIWNLRATAGEFHAQANTEGVLMYSGWSPSIFKQLIKEGFKVHLLEFQFQYQKVPLPTCHAHQVGPQSLSPSPGP